MLTGVVYRIEMLFASSQLAWTAKVRNLKTSGRGF